jgi:single-strand DNA-binding protein
MWLAGHLGQDPQIRVLPGGKEVVSLNLAVNRKQKGEDVTDWYSIDCWEQTALQAKTYMAKGMQICVQGRVRIDAWDVRPPSPPTPSHRTLGDGAIDYKQRESAGCWRVEACRWLCV